LLDLWIVPYDTIVIGLKSTYVCLQDPRIFDHSLFTLMWYIHLILV